MNDPQVLVSQKLIDKLRQLLIVLAQTDDRPPSERNRDIEQPRQYCEGYLNVNRKALQTLNKGDVDEVLKVTGFMPNE